MVEDIIIQKMGTHGNVNLYFVVGDSTQLSVDALITTWDPDGGWKGRLDHALDPDSEEYNKVHRAIERAAKKQYHSQLAEKLENEGLSEIVVEGDREKHKGEFDHVIFLADTSLTIEEAFYCGCKTAHEQGYQSIALVPTGFCRIDQFTGLDGLRRYLEEFSQETSLEEIYVVTQPTDEDDTFLRNSWPFFSIFALKKS